MLEDNEFKLMLLVVLADIRDEIRRFNDREEAGIKALPEGWTLDIPVS